MEDIPGVLACLERMPCGVYQKQECRELLDTASTTYIFVYSWRILVCLGMEGASCRDADRQPGWNIYS